MNLTRVTPPDEDFIQLSELKSHLRVYHDDDDAYINGLYLAAMAHIDGPRGVLGRCIQPQQWRIVFPTGSRVCRYRLPIYGITTISSEWIDAGETPEPAVVSIECSDPWYVVSVPGILDRDLAITMSAETPDDCWGAIRMAVKLLVGHWYLHREAVVIGASVAALPLSVERFLTPLKVWRV